MVTAVPTVALKAVFHLHASQGLMRRELNLQTLIAYLVKTFSVFCYRLHNPSRLEKKKTFIYELIKKFSAAHHYQALIPPPDKLQHQINT